MSEDKKRNVYKAIIVFKRPKEDISILNKALNDSGRKETASLVGPAIGVPKIYGSVLENIGHSFFNAVESICHSIERPRAWLPINGGEPISLYEFNQVLERAQEQGFKVTETVLVADAPKVRTECRLEY